MIYLHPQVSAIDCRKCSKFSVDLKTGVYFQNGELLVPRGKDGPPCRTNSKACPKGGPGKSDLTPENRKVLEHFLECKATGQWPDDGLLRYHAGLLTRIIDECRESLRRRNARNDMADLIGMIARVK